MGLASKKQAAASILGNIISPRAGPNPLPWAESPRHAIWLNIMYWLRVCRVGFFFFLEGGDCKLQNSIWEGLNEGYVIITDPKLSEASKVLAEIQPKPFLAFSSHQDHTDPHLDLCPCVCVNTLLSPQTCFLYPPPLDSFHATPKFYLLSDLAMHKNSQFQIPRKKRIRLTQLESRTHLQSNPVLTRQTHLEIISQVLEQAMEDS